MLRYACKIGRQGPGEVCAPWVESERNEEGRYVLYTDHAKLRDALVEALEVCTTWLTARPAPDNVHYKAKAIAEARAALAQAKES